MANSLNATFENILDETPPKRLKHSVLLEQKDDPVCRSANARFGFNLVILTVRRLLPIYPDKQTSSESVGMSQRCQYRTFANAAYQFALITGGGIHEPLRTSALGQ